MTEDAFRIVSAAAVGLAALAFAVQTGILIALYCVSTKTQRIVTKFIDDVKALLANAGTALSTASQIMDETRHPIKEVVVDAVTIGRPSRQQVRQLGDLLHYVNEHARTRLERIDSTGASAVACVEHVVTRSTVQF